MSFHFSPRRNRAHEIQWRPWSAQAFAEAKAQDKPVLLAISAVWCHWCHVMDETTYSSDEVIRAINDRYIPVRVDNDQRPDINARYNMGGWPTTAVLTPDGTTLTGGTYVPAAQMLQMLEHVERFYREHKTDIQQRGVDLQTRSPRMQPGSSGDLRNSMVTRIVEEISETYDDLYGGFGTQPKFPHTEQLELLLLEYRLSDEQRLYDMASKTMLGMSRGGMYDHVEGGFFRYSTTRDWSVPHFEKMAEDHAGLLRVLATLVLIGGRPEFNATLRSAVDYVLSVLRNPDSAFFGGSQDADEAYYALALDERRKTAAPYVDRTIYTNWNASLASALYAVASALNDDQVAQVATATVGALDDRMRDRDGLLYHFAPQDGSPRARGLLTDQAAYLRSLIDAHEHTGEGRFIDRAEQLVLAVDARFEHDDGPYDDHAAIEEQLGNLAFKDRPLHENALVADSFLRLASLTEDASYRTRAEAILCAYAKTYGQAGSFAASYARAVRRYLSTASTLCVVGDRRSTDAFREAGRGLSDPLLTTRTLDPSHAEILRRRGYESTPLPAAFLCRGSTCAAPVHDPGDLRAAALGLTGFDLSTGCG